MNKRDMQVLEYEQEIIPYEDFRDMAIEIKNRYYFSDPVFWAWKAFQLGHAYGKRSERLQNDE